MDWACHELCFPGVVLGMGSPGYLSDWLDHELCLRRPGLGMGWPRQGMCYSSAAWESAGLSMAGILIILKFRRFLNFENLKY
jgi:hypothetical protein